MNKQLKKELNESLIKYCSQGNFEQVQFLISQGADVHTNNNSALPWSAINGHLEVVKYLVEQGADIHADNDKALRWSVESGYLDIVEFLVKNGANIHAQNDYSLNASVLKQQLEVVELLFNKYSEDNKQKLAIDIINNNASEEFIKFFNAKILSDKLHGDLNNNRLLIKKTKI